MKECDKFDRFDLKILCTLWARGRVSKTDLSQAIGLSLTPSCARLEQLEKKKVIRGYHADVDLKRLDLCCHYLVTVSLTGHSARARGFEDAIAKIPFILQADAVLGSTDYVLRIVATDIDHHHEIMAPLERFEIDYTTLAVSKTLRRPQDATLLDLVKLTAQRWADN